MRDMKGKRVGRRGGQGRAGQGRAGQGRAVKRKMKGGKGEGRGEAT